MGIQSVVLLAGLAVALIGAILAGAVDAPDRLAGWLAMGAAVVAWTLVLVTERVLRRELWLYTAAYPDPLSERAGAREAAHQSKAPAAAQTRDAAEGMPMAA